MLFSGVGGGSVARGLCATVCAILEDCTIRLFDF